MTFVTLVVFGEAEGTKFMKYETEGIREVFTEVAAGPLKMEAAGYTEKVITINETI